MSTARQPLDITIDVRDLVPGLRRPLMLAALESLGLGDCFRIVNDLDPALLLDRFSVRHADAFRWSYEQQGPRAWRVRIERPVAGN